VVALKHYVQIQSIPLFRTALLVTDTHATCKEQSYKLVALLVSQ